MNEPWSYCDNRVTIYYLRHRPHYPVSPACLLKLCMMSDNFWYWHSCSSSSSVRKSLSMTHNCGLSFWSADDKGRRFVGSTVSATHEATLKPRNPRQVKNAQAQAQRTEDTHGVICSTWWSTELYTVASSKAYPTHPWTSPEVNVTMYYLWLERHMQQWCICGRRSE